MLISKASNGIATKPKQIPANMPNNVPILTNTNVFFVESNSFFSSKKNSEHPTATESIAAIKKNIEGLLNSPL